MTREKKLENLFKNGITTEDLDKAGKEGFDAGWKASCDGVVKNIYAAAAMTLRDEFHFDQGQIIRFLQKMDFAVCYTVNTREAMDEVFDKIGIDMQFDAPFDRIEAKA
jgi:hypothetical protein